MRGGAPGGKVVAMRDISAAAGSLLSNLRCAKARDVSAPKMAAPVGLAHRMPLASAFQSQAGRALVASGASLLSVKKDSRNSLPSIRASTLGSDAAGFSRARACQRPRYARPHLLQKPDNLNRTSCQRMGASRANHSASARMIL
jgi:hypothetical protein